MTKNNEQIIIDRVDVSGCRFYSEKLSTMKGTGSISAIKCNGFCTHNIRGLDNSSCYDAHIEYAKCKNNNCYYKQLLRIEQECEKLTSKCSQLEEIPRKIRNIILKFAKQDILTFPDLKPEDNYAIIQNQCLDPIRQIIKFLDEMEDKNA